MTEYISKRNVVLTVILLLLVVIYGIIFTKGNLGLLINPKKITPVSLFYTVKLSREFFQSKFVFGTEDMANWKLTLAEKRLAEARILKDYGVLESARNQVLLASRYLKDANSSIKFLQDKADINYLLVRSELLEGELKQLSF